MKGKHDPYLRLSRLVACIHSEWACSEKARWGAAPCNEPVSGRLCLSGQICTLWEASFSWQGQLPAHLMSAWRSRIMVRHGTVVIPVNRMAEGEGRAPVKLPFFSATLSCLDSGLALLAWCVLAGCENLIFWCATLEWLVFDNPFSSSLPLSHRLHDKLPLLFYPPFFTFLSSQCQPALKTTDFFPLFPFFIVWIESNKDSFLFDVIKLLRPDLGVRVNFFPKHRRELSPDFRCQTLFQASQHLVFPPQVKWL